MSTLRNNLDQAMAEYHSAQYPGDLATELLSMRLAPDPVVQLKPEAIGRGRAGSRGGALWWTGVVGSAVAAGFVAAVLINPFVQGGGGGAGSGGTVNVVRAGESGQQQPLVFSPLQLPAGPIQVVPGRPFVGRDPSANPTLVNDAKGSGTVFRNMNPRMQLQPDTNPENYTKP